MPSISNSDAVSEICIILPPPRSSYITLVVDLSHYTTPFFRVNDFPKRELPFSPSCVPSQILLLILKNYAILLKNL